MRSRTIRIGCASAFWGDSSSAVPQLVKKGSLNYLVFDYLAEVTMSILAAAKLKNKDMGYAGDFIKHISPYLSSIKKNGIKLISNAGGLNLEACRSALQKEAEKAGVEFKIAIINGDNLKNQEEKLRKIPVSDLDTGHPMPDTIISINAYLGAVPIKRALEEGADIVITGRCVDSAVVLGPLMYEFGWSTSDYDLLASGTLAGHIVDCATQCTGGNFTDWQMVPGFDDMGFPILEIEKNGNFIVTKPRDTGGLINKGAVAEQLLYEIGDPRAYIVPDVVCNFAEVKIEETCHNEVKITGAKGYPPTESYKVCATFQDGYHLSIPVVIGGIKAAEKAQLIGESIIKKTSRMFREAGYLEYTDTHISILGTESIYGHNAKNLNPREVVLRLKVTHSQKEALILLSREIAHAATGMAPGLISLLGGRQTVSPLIRLYSFLIPKNLVHITLDINSKIIPIEIPTDGGYSLQDDSSALSCPEPSLPIEKEVPLILLAYARSGDKGDDVLIGVIAREKEFLAYIRASLTTEVISSYFSHVLKGKVSRFEVPGISGLNFQLKHALGGGGMASLFIDSQGKSYAQQLLDIPIGVPANIAEMVLSK